MQQERNSTGTRATITLQGGGRLAGVSQVLEVRLKAKDVEWEPLGEGTLTVRGEIHSYVYFMRAGSRVIEGEGLAIPFSREIEVPGLDLEHVDVEIEELVSDHDFDPLTTDFQHRITVILRVRQVSSPGVQPAAEEEEAPLPEPESDATERSIIAVDRPEGEAVVGVRAALSDMIDQSSHVGASGETRFSQIRSGPSPTDAPEGEVIEAPPDPKPKGGRDDILVWKPFPPPIDEGG